MYKKIISVMSVALVVFLCASPVFASTVAPRTKYYTYDYGDVLLQIEATSYFSDATDPSAYYQSMSETSSGYYQFSYTYGDNIVQNVDINVQFFNKTSQYQLASDNWLNFGIITGQSDFFSSNSVYYRFTNVSDNIVLKPSMANDSFWVAAVNKELLQLDPNAVVTYNFTIQMVTNGHQTPQQNNDWFNVFSRTNSSLAVSHKPDSFTAHDIDYYLNNNSFPHQIIPYLHGILTRLKEIKDNYDANIPASDNLTNDSSQASSTIDSQHQTESNYFSDSQSAIQGTGIQNFQFNSQELGGLNGLKDDFTAVWTACGSLSRYWITSLTIGLALAIIRHRRMFEK